MAETKTKTKTCVDCDAVVSRWWECEDGDPYCAECWEAMGRSCEGCSHDDCHFCKEEEDAYECYCQECGEVIEGMTEEEFVKDDELKLCDECREAYETTAECRCDACGNCTDVSFKCLHEKVCRCEGEGEGEEEAECCGCGKKVRDEDDFGNNADVADTCCKECWEKHGQEE